ncbi:MAG: SUMF1/EgtB/PvdO family nonheme iron enzyme, partial [Victivallales bacterium]|nr:SUMF1/EgtB/PvdO family nonheme iron enzyme [Victivallales bacterium]
AIVRDVAVALAYAWDEFQLLHRDIKPANIMVDRRQRIFLMDLGLAKSLGEDHGMTLSGAILGTPQYMSPEQAQGQSDLGVASDVYSLGATLYHLATGAPPFAGDSVLKVLHQHVHAPLPAPRERNPDLSEGCARLIERMLAKKPEDRYGDWRALVADLAAVQGHELPTDTVSGAHHRGGVANPSDMAHQAQEALARQRHKPDHHAPNSARHPSRPLYRSPLVLGIGAASLALLLVLGIAVGRARKGTGKPKATTVATKTATTPQAGTGRKEGDESGAEPPAKAPEVAATAVRAKAPEPGPEAVPDPVPETATAKAPNPVSVAANSNVREALSRISLPHSGDWALGFDGKGGGVVVPGLDWDFSVPLTVEAVFMALGSEPAFIAGRGGTAGVWLGTRDGMVVAYRRGEAGTVVSAQARLVERRAMHAAAVWDGTELRLYINGYLVAKGGAPHAWPDSGHKEFLVGALGDVRLAGTVETVRVSKVACYTEDFELDQALPLKPDADTLCLLDFEEGKGDVAKDASGHGHDGRIADAAWRKMWPSAMAEGELREVEANLRKANPTAADLLLKVVSVPSGVNLDLGGIATLHDLSPLAGLPIVGLDVTRTSVSDLSPLRGMRIGWLGVDRWGDYTPIGDGIEDLSPLKGMPLVFLTLYGHHRVKDLLPLQGCPLRTLYVGSNAASDLSPLAGMPLEILRLAGDAIRDLSPIQNAPLRVLLLPRCPSVADLSPIGKCTELEFLCTPLTLPPPTAQLTDRLPNLKYLNPDAQTAAEAQEYRWSIGKQLHLEWTRSLETTGVDEPAVEAEGPREKTLERRIARSLLAGDYSAALGRWRENGDTLGAGLTDAQRQDVAAQLAALAGMDEQILASFRPDIGKTLAVELAKGKATCEIREVRGGGIRVMQTVRQGQTTGRAGRTLRLADLGVAEKLRRLGTDETPKRNLQRGMLALQAGRADVASRLFAKADAPLGEALAAALAERQAQARRQAAERAVSELLRQVGTSPRLGTREQAIADIRKRCGGDPRRVQRSHRLLAKFEKDWGDSKTGREWVPIVREALSCPWPGENWTVPSVSMEFVWVAPGTFMRVAEGHEAVRTAIAHKVRITKGFWLGKYEVTQAEYKTIMGKNPSHFKGERNPVERVSWSNAMAFCRKLTEQEQAAGRLPAGYEYRLPTEAEWQYVARGGSRSRGFSYAGSNDLAEVAWHMGNSDEKAHPVGQKKPNELGFHDMSGNVAEWCQDWVASYPRGPVTDPQGALAGGGHRVSRGGSWSSSATYCHSARRHPYTPETADFNLGFRVALAAPLR